MAAARDIVEKSGAWYAYQGEKVGQGREASKAYLQEHPEVMEEIAKKVLDHDKPKPAPEKATEDKKAADTAIDKDDTKAEKSPKATPVTK